MKASFEMKNKKLLEDLQENGLWLVIHPVQRMGWEADQMFPWLGAEMVRMSQRINYYLRPCHHKFIVINDDDRIISTFSKYPQIKSLLKLNRYCVKHNITKLIYTGFHYGICLLSEKEVGMEAIDIHNKNQKRIWHPYEMFVKRELTMVGPSADEDSWRSADYETGKFAQII